MGDIVTMKWRWSYLFEITVILLIIGIIDTRITDHAIERASAQLIQDGVNGLLSILIGDLNSILLASMPVLPLVFKIGGAILFFFVLFKLLLPSMLQGMKPAPMKKEEKKDVHH
jgi:hypothetical protein